MKSTTGDCEIVLRLSSDEVRNVTKRCCEEDFDDLEAFGNYDSNHDDREDVEMEIIRDEDLVPEALISITKRVLSCSDIQCRESEECFDLINGPNCSCKPGFQKKNEGNCQDIDECASGLDKCRDYRKNCINTQGSFECQGCLKGFTRVQKYFEEDDDDFCVDSNECLENVCGKNEFCTNVEGSYRCTNISCPLKYVHFNNT